MDELTAQLRKLGEAAEAQVEPVWTAEAFKVEPQGAAATDIGLGARHEPSGRRTRPKVSPRVMAGAIAAILVAFASIALVGRGDKDPPLDVASQDNYSFEVPADDNGWHELRLCESSNNYDLDTGTSFYGAYQFERSSWNSKLTRLGIDSHPANPANAPAEIQDAVANALYLESGASSWPVCGYHVKGPMITPVVPHWMGQTIGSYDRLIVFINPNVEADRLAEIGAQINAIANPNGETAIRFVDKQAALAEFHQMFIGNDQARGSVSADDMPPSFRILRSVSPADQQRLRDVSGVFEVVTPDTLRGSPEAGPIKIAIPAIGLETAVYTTASNGDLERGPVVMVNDPGILVVAGYGSVEGSVFGRLGNLRDGDRIVVSTLVAEPGASSEWVRTFQVDLGAADVAPPTVDLDGMSLWRSELAQGLTLVADVEGDPLKRLIVRTRATDPDMSGYNVGVGD